MPELSSQKMEGACLSYIECGDKSESYRRNYKTDKMKPATINRAAKELFDNPKMTTRLAELRAPVLKRAELTLESHLSRLNQLSIQAEASEQFSAAITAETNRGKASGLYVEKVETTGKDGGAIENKWVVEIVKPGGDE